SVRSSALPECLDAVVSPGMRGKESSPSRSFRLHEPGERGDHDLFGLADSLEKDHAMLIGLILLLPAVAPCDQGPSDRRKVAAAGNDLIEDDHADAETRIQTLRLGDVPEIVVGDLVREYGHELLVVRLPQEAGGHVELPVTRARRVDVGLIDDTH